MGGGYQRSRDGASLEENRVHTKKKKYGVSVNAPEDKRQAFLAQLATKTGELIVYADEAGMDDRDDYAYGWNQRGQRFYALKSGRRLSSGQHESLQKELFPLQLSPDCGAL